MSEGKFKTERIQISQIIIQNKTVSGQLQYGAEQLASVYFRVVKITWGKNNPIYSANISSYP